MLDMTKDAGREQFYGMPFEEFEALHQTDADGAKLEKFKHAYAENVDHK